MGEEKGFTVQDRRRVKIDTDSAETKPDAGAEGSGTAQRRTDETATSRLPPVDFTAFLLGLSQMALVHLGELPDPGTGERSLDLEQARHSIDILDMLEQKTRGNLTQEEATLLQTLEGELKMKYVQLSRRTGGAR